jgi:hypothetical protein
MAAPDLYPVTAIPQLDGYRVPEAEQVDTPVARKDLLRPSVGGARVTLLQRRPLQPVASEHAGALSRRRTPAGDFVSALHQRSCRHQTALEEPGRSTFRSALSILSFPFGGVNI